MTGGETKAMLFEYCHRLQNVYQCFPVSKPKYIWRVQPEIFLAVQRHCLCKLLLELKPSPMLSQSTQGPDQSRSEESATIMLLVP